MNVESKYEDGSEKRRFRLSIIFTRSVRAYQTIHISVQLVENSSRQSCLLATATFSLITMVA